MPRLVRIALTLFAAATILVFLIWQRIGRMQGITGEVAEEFARQEAEMIAIGLILAGGMACGGFVLILVAMFRGRRKPDRS